MRLASDNATNNKLEKKKIRIQAALRHLKLKLVETLIISMISKLNRRNIFSFISILVYTYYQIRSEFVNARSKKEISAKLIN